MKPPLRTKSVGTKVSEAEFALLEERARGAGMRLAEWVREALLSAQAESQQSGPDEGSLRWPNHGPSTGMRCGLSQPTSVLTGLTNYSTL